MSKVCYPHLPPCLPNLCGICWQHIVQPQGDFPGPCRSSLKVYICAGVRNGPVTQNTTNLITVSLLPVAILMIGYALTTYILRSSYLRRKKVRPCTSVALAEQCCQCG